MFGVLCVWLVFVVWLLLGGYCVLALVLVLVWWMHVVVSGKGVGGVFLWLVGFQKCAKDLVGEVGVSNLPLDTRT